MHLCFENDTDYDLIMDYRRMYLVENSEAVKNGESVTEVYCFNPEDRSKSNDFANYERCMAMVNYKANKKKITVYSL